MRRLSSFTSFSKMSLTACGSSRNIRHWAGEREEQKKKKKEDIRYFRMKKQHYPRLHSNALICCFHRTLSSKKENFSLFHWRQQKTQKSFHRKTRLVLLDTEISKVHWWSTSHFVGMSQLKCNRHNTELCVRGIPRLAKIWEHLSNFKTGCLNTFRQWLTKKQSTANVLVRNK